MSSNEDYYDENIAPRLAELARECTEHGLSFFAAVEYEPGEIAETRMFVPGYSSTMMRLSSILRICGRALTTTILRFGK
jgi:hypothetical protein